jgi:hypothetical protein
MTPPGVTAPCMEGYRSLGCVAAIWQNRDIFAACCGNGDIMLYKYSYPKDRSVKDASGIPKGVPGECKLLNKKNLSTQPICSFDWHPDKRGLCVMGAAPDFSVALLTLRVLCCGRMSS